MKQQKGYLRKEKHPRLPTKIERFSRRIEFYAATIKFHKITSMKDSVQLDANAVRNRERCFSITSQVERWVCITSPLFYIQPIPKPNSYRSILNS
jgi:hypothetical protein